MGLTNLGRPRRTALAVSAAGLGLGVLAGCGGDTAGPETGASVGEIQNDQAPAEAAENDVMSFVGQTVTVSAEVNEIIAPDAFTIAGDGFFGGEPLLIVSPPGGPAVQEGSPVQVTGTVRQAFDLPAVEQEFGFDLDDNLFGAYSGEPYIAASNIDPTLENFTEPTIAPTSAPTPAPASPAPTN